MTAKAKVVNLFGGGKGGAPSNGTPGSRHLVELKAGRLHKDGARVTADQRPGTLYLTKNADDQLLHWCWKQRDAPGAQPEEDYIMFAADAEFVSVQQAGSRGVYVLKFHSSSTRHFYWLQEPFVTQDTAESHERELQLVKRINVCLQHGGGVTEAQLSGGGSGGAAQQANALASGMSEQQQQQLLSLLQEQGMVTEDQARQLRQHNAGQSQAMQEVMAEQQQGAAAGITVELLQPIKANPEWRAALFPQLITQESDLAVALASQAFRTRCEEVEAELGTGIQLMQRVGVTDAELAAQQQGGQSTVVTLLKALKRKSEQPTHDVNMGEQ